MSGTVGIWTGEMDQPPPPIQPIEFNPAPADVTCCIRRVDSMRVEDARLFQVFRSVQDLIEFARVNNTEKFDPGAVILRADCDLYTDECRSRGPHSELVIYDYYVE